MFGVLKLFLGFLLPYSIQITAVIKKSYEHHNAFLKTLLVWHRFSAQTAKHSQKSKYPQLKSPGCLCLQRYILESDFGISTNVGMTFLCKLMVKPYMCKDVQKDVLQVMKTEENTQRHTSVATALSAADLCLFSCRAGESDIVPCSINFCPISAFPSGVRGTEARIRNSAK